MSSVNNKIVISQDKWDLFKLAVPAPTLEAGMSQLSFEPPRTTEEFTQKLHEKGLSIITASQIAGNKGCLQVQNLCYKIFERELMRRLEGAKGDLKEAIKIRDGYFRELNIGPDSELSELQENVGEVFFANFSTEKPNEADPCNEEMIAFTLKAFRDYNISLKEQFTLFAYGRNITQLTFNSDYQNFTDHHLRAILNCFYNLKVLKLDSVPRLSKQGLVGHPNLTHLEVNGSSIRSADLEQNGSFPALKTIINNDYKRRFYWEDAYSQGSNLENLQFTNCYSIAKEGDLEKRLQPYFEDFVAYPTSQKLKELIALYKLDCASYVYKWIAIAGQNLWSHNRPLAEEMAAALIEYYNAFSVVSVLESPVESEFNEYVQRRAKLPKVNPHFSTLAMCDKRSDLVAKEMQILLDSWAKKCIEDKDHLDTNSFEMQQVISLKGELREAVLPIAFAAALALNDKGSSSFLRPFEELPAYSLPIYFRNFMPITPTIHRVIPEFLSWSWTVNYIKENGIVKNRYETLPDVWNHPEFQ